VTAVDIRLGDQHWSFDEEELDLHDSFRMKQATGQAFTRTFFAGIEDMDPACLQALVWFVRNKAGESLLPHDVNFKLSELRVEPRPDPTEGDATPSGNDATA
jgi:hypothetical protein